MRTFAVLFLSAILLAGPVLGGSQPKTSRKAPAKKSGTEAVKSAVDQAENATAPSRSPEPLREKKYFYSSFGTRDPFRSLVGGDFEPKLQELVDLHTVQLVGVLWEEEAFVAMVQDSQGFGYNLRPGDRVRNGTVVSVSKEALVGRLNVFGQTTRITLRLQREE